jgi:secreted trypsin-like serine protease
MSKSLSTPKLIFAVLNVAATTACVPTLQSRSTPHIAGGTVIQDTTHPIARSTVAIVRPENLPFGKTTCSGVLIEPNIVLTAAHCFQTASAENIRAVFATKVAGASGNAVRDVAALLIHPEFFPDAALGRNHAPANDIAVLILKDNAPDGYVPVKLAALQPPPQNVELAGFGLQSESDLKSSGVLKSVPARVVENDSYRKILTVESGSTQGSGSSQNPTPEGALRGDSGGPAYQNTSAGLEVVGVLSTGGVATSGTFNGKNVYTHVAHYAPWVADSVTRLKSGAQASQPVTGLSYLVEKKGTSHFSITVTNTTEAHHVCHVSVSATVLYPQMERTEKLALTRNPTDSESSLTLLVTLPANGTQNPYATFFVLRKTPDRPYKDFLVRAQCDSAPPSAMIKAALSNEMERELRAAGY